MNLKYTKLFEFDRRHGIRGLYPYNITVYETPSGRIVSLISGGKNNTIKHWLDVKDLIYYAKKSNKLEDIMKIKRIKI